jgi:Uma2 family endonuclease
MPAIASTEQRVVLHSVSWETYERLLAERQESTGTRFAYDEGELEIMVVSAGHEAFNRNLAAIAELVAVATRRPFWPAGSTTFRRRDLAKGFEPDSCFYIDHAAAVRGKPEIDPATDPAPDLLIEVDLTSSSLNRFAIFAVIGVPEIWRFDGARVSIHRLAAGSYHQVADSQALPPVTAFQLTAFLEAAAVEDRADWSARITAWAKKPTAP